ncbi:MAG: tetratricopeptide repeat protein [Polyangiaceae bacterium]|nr:tetratricopeptide repeat protein [Polyangiaceae bacterium]
MSRALPLPGRLLFLVLPLLMGCDKPSELVAEHLRRGDMALADGHFAQALSAYAHAHELAPHDARVQRAQMRGRVYLLAHAPTRVAQEALEDLAYEATLLRETEKGLDAVCLTALGHVLARRGDMEGAKAKFAEAVKADPQSHVPHVALGMFYLNEPSGSATAKLEFELALQRKPDAPGALLGLGRIKLAEGDVAGAIDKLEAAARQEDDPAVRLALGTARLRQGKHADAARELRRALAFDPKNVDALSALGQALLGLGQLEEAEDALRTAMQSRQDQATAIALGFTLVKLDRAEQALSIFGQVLARNARVAPAIFGSGMANERLGKTQEALVNYRQVLALPAEGPQKDSVLELQRDAKGRVDALTPAPAPTSSATVGENPKYL